MLAYYLPLLILFAVVFGFVFTTMIVTHLLGPKRHSKQKDSAFECGIPSVGDARSSFSVHYFLVAILFVLFDVEVVFFYPWALQLRELGWRAFLDIVIYTSIICSGLFFVFKHRILDFESHA